MAIINTFEKCLDSPYLFHDTDAPGRVEALIQRAEERIRLAEQITKNGAADSLDISFFSHEAMLCCIRALVYAKGYREAGLKCLLLAWFGLYVKPGLLDAAHIQAFEAAQSLKASPSENLEAAQALFESARLILSVPNESPAPAVSLK